MIEVFRTTVSNSFYANLLISKISGMMPGARVNFDLSDCDRILRIENSREFDCNEVIEIVRNFGYSAEILPDEIPRLTPVIRHKRHAV